MKKYIYILAVFTLLSCGGSKQAVEDSRYKRKPMVEVSQEQLDVEGMMTSAKVQQLVGNTADAVEQYYSILKKVPGYGPACYELSGLLNIDSALAYAQKAVGSDPTNVWYLMRLAEIYGQQHDGKHLTETWETIVKQHPATLDYYYELSNAYLTDNRIAKAVEVLDRVEKMVGVTEMVSMQKKRLWEAIGRPDKATVELEKLAEAMPQDGKYSAILAQQYMNQGKYDKAKRHYDHIVEVNPDDEYVHLSLATYYKVKGQEQQAYEELRIGLQNPNIDINSKLGYLVSFYPNEEFFGAGARYAFPLLDLVMGQCEDKSEYALFYGDVLMRQNKYAEAAEQFKTAIARDSSKYEVWEALLICMSETTDEAGMLDYAGRAQKLFPLHALPYYLQGFSAFQHKQYVEAEQALKSCEKLGFPNGYLEAETYNLLGTCLYDLEKYDEAFGYFDKYLSIQPDDAICKNNYAYFLSERGIRLDEALKMIQEAVAAAPDNGIFLDTYAWVLYKMGRMKEALIQIEKAVALNPDRASLREHLETIRKAQ